MSTQVIDQPTLTIDTDPHQPGTGSVSVHNLHPDQIASLVRCPQANRLLQSVLRVRVSGLGAQAGDDLPDVYGRHQILENRLRFTPHFPFEPGVQFRATFDPRPLGRPGLSEVLTLEFCFPRTTRSLLTQVEHVFPSSASLPENTLRFYVCFSKPMQRGRAADHIALLGPDGRPAPDTLYRPPVELWDRNMRHLTILLDPGRLKRGVGPNRELGPPLRPGQEYKLVIGSGMIDSCGCPLRESFCKSFRVTEAIREPIAIERWKIVSPAAKSRQPLALLFPKPLDWALLWRTITIASKCDQPIDGQIAIDRDEERWCFTPRSPWPAGWYHLRIGSDLEDVCGNSVLEAFDRPLRSANDLVSQAAERSIPFHLL